MSKSITIEAVRAMRWDGNIIEPGRTLKLSALEAAQAVGSGRARLVHPDDAVLCQEATRADIKQAIRAERQAVFGPPDDPRWQRV